MSTRWATSMPALPLASSTSDFPMVPGIRRGHGPYVKMLQGTRPGSSGMIRPSKSQPILRGYGEGTRPGTAGSSVPARTREGSCIPDYITKEKQVLRFFAYFQEPVHEGGSMDATGFRVRKFSIMYFLSDSTISIEEPRITNSGLTQGKFMRRLQVTRPLNSCARDARSAGGNASPVRATGGGGNEGGVMGGSSGKGGATMHPPRDIYAPGDFGVGEEVWIHGRRFRIVDADLTTRQWFQRNLGRSLKPAENYPEDGYGAERAKVSAPKKRSMMPAREKGEFYKKDRKVLRFFCKYKDSRLQGDKRDYILYYYLLNDTIEIKEVAAEGRHNFPNLLRRQKLPKDSMFVPTGYGGVISPRDPQRFHHPRL
ncbi:unnamed protein product [Ectocarpus sp. 12 AP-2014]